MNSWKQLEFAKSLVVGVVVASVCLALPVVALAQSSDPQNGPTRPWADGNQNSQQNENQNQNSQQYSQPNQNSQANYFSQPAQPAYAGSPGGYSQAVNSYSQPSYNAPPEGYSQSYDGRQGQMFNPGIMPHFNNEAPQGILSSRQQPPTLPEGLVLPIQLDSSIDTEKASPGDYVQAHLSQNISAGGSGYLKGGSVITGTISEVPEEKHEGHAGKISINFNQVRLPNGTLVPMKAHLVGRIANYIYKNGRSNGVMATAWRDGLGSEVSSGSGSMIATGGGGYGPGSAAYGGALLGGASMLLTSMFYHHHNDIFLHPGTRLQLQLDEGLLLPGYGRNVNHELPGSGANTGIFILIPDFDYHIPTIEELKGCLLDERSNANHRLVSISSDKRNPQRNPHKGTHGVPLPCAGRTLTPGEKLVKPQAKLKGMSTALSK